MQIQKQSLVQQQRLVLSPQLVQSIKLMAMPFAELRDRILEEVDKNPALEVVSDPFISSDWPHYSGGPEQFPVSSGGGDEESDEHRDFIEGTLHRDETLQERLLNQLAEQKLTAPVRTLAELIVQNLDHDGFHIVPPQELPGADNPEHLTAALDVVHRLEPVGCATTGFHETLVVQAKLLQEQAVRSGYKTKGKKFDNILQRTIDILEHHFELLEKGRPDALIKALKKKPEVGFTLEADEADEVFEIIRSLDPFPGRAFDHSPESYIAPDVFVRKNEDGFSVVINEEEIPIVGIAPFFMELGTQTKSEDKDRDEDAVALSDIPRDARNFARESVKEAQWFMHTLTHRNLTILKVTRAIVMFQNDFFLYGPSRLSPLRMKDVADETGMHEATVSRAVNGKYLQCEWGLFELKYFFSNQVGSAGTNRYGTEQAYTAGRFSKQGVKEILREIISESKEKLSDQKLTEELALRGIKIARRTVAKYRSELDIKSSFER